MTRARNVLALLAALFMMAMQSAAFAHKPSDSYLKLDVEGATINGQWDIALRDLDFAIGLDANQYWTMTYQSLRNEDVTMGLIKPVLFGFIIASVGCYYGLSAKGGTQGVGRATTQAVVAASVMILVVDFFITRLLMAINL